ncbi:OmpH family outer membrane protein [Pedobacter flavus]|uniref:OmpH family outer membrane protein n=1 Tax=Pedobacter flavus TaxID=3113906 RepID=A0ABU7H1F5_9SPHI|nr:OmpH family outer membrane protein [Pedobacter sp. VNH31]MEE1885157.1 OmpH family outer membrane protein [Pedobacter sp. VNH31]
MKFNFLKTSLMVSTLALTTAFVSCKDNGSNSASNSKDSSSVKADQEEIVFVNSDSLLNNYAYFKDLQTKLDASTSAAENDLRSKTQAFQREVNQYQQQQNSMPADQRAATEQRLARKQQELQSYQQNAGLALQNEQGTEQVKLYNRVADYLKVYAKEKGFKMVLTYTKGNSSILFADEKLDVTSEVIKGLNEEYKKNPKK